MMNQPDKMKSILVNVSANAEWRIVKEYYRPTICSETPFGEWFEERVGETLVIFLQGGWGKISAAASTQYALDRWKPNLLVNLGTCGGFEGAVERGEIILAEETLVYDIYERMGDAQEAVDFYTTQIKLDWLDDALPFPVRRTRLLSADRDIDPVEVEDLRQRFNVLAADWESGAIAWVAQRNNVRCLILRAVTDLVASRGGEAYGALEVFTEGTRQAMTRLLDGLPAVIGACKM